MSILAFLIPLSIFLGLLGLAGFFWALKTRQFEDPEGDSQRILSDDWDDKPKPD